MKFPTSLTEFTFYRGRVALYAILKSLGIDNGDEIMVQAFTCIAVPEGIIAAGAKPVYIDIESGGFNMDPEDLERKISPKTKAIIIQHTYGIPADLDKIISIANKMNIPVIEDCCHTLFSKYKGKMVGTFGVGSFYSFEWGKPIVVGVGGSAVVNEPALKENIFKNYMDYKFPSFINQIRLQLQYFSHKILYRPTFFWPVRNIYHFLGSLGAAESNYNPVDADNVAKDFSLRMAEALKKRLENKLKYIGKATSHSSWVTSEYKTKINSPFLHHPMKYEDHETIFARYPLLVKNKSLLLKKARKANIELADWYNTPIHPLKNEELNTVNYELGSCPNAENRCNQIVTLPTNYLVKQNYINKSVKFLNEVEL